MLSELPERLGPREARGADGAARYRLGVPHGLHTGKLEDNRAFRSLNVFHDINRLAIGRTVDFSLPSERVMRQFKQIISRRGKPQFISWTTPFVHPFGDLDMGGLWGIRLSTSSLSTLNIMFVSHGSTVRCDSSGSYSGAGRSLQKSKTLRCSR